jgi:integrase
MPLTDTAIRAAKPTEKQQKIFDGSGLYLLVFPSGSKVWRFKYRFQGKEKLISFGQYPVVSLKDARERAADARKMLGGGKDPSMERKESKLQQQNTFELVAREWYAKQTPKWTEGHAGKILRLLGNNVFPYIGSRPVADILPSELLTIIQRIEDRDALTMAHYTRSLCSNIFRYAVITGRAERDPAADIRGAISARIAKNYAAITDPMEVGRLLLAIDKYHASFTIRNALRLLPLVFCRPVELRSAEWSEFDFEDNLWRIPGEKMKMSRDHLVPLSTQAIAILKEMFSYSGDGRYVFPSPQRGKGIQGHSTLVNSLRRMGFTRDQMCAHGFRATASTLLNEMGYPSDVIERQLAHAPGNKVRAAYNRAEYLPERRKMMQDWSNYLDSLRERARETELG